MFKWNVSVYRHAQDFEEAKEIGVFDHDEDQAILVALEALRKENPKCVPIVARVPHGLVEITHCVKHGGEYDALFHSSEMAYEWLERQVHAARSRYASGVDVEVDDDYSIFCLSPTFNRPKPKSIWEWLKNPGPFSFDEPPEV